MASEQFPGNILVQRTKLTSNARDREVELWNHVSRRKYGARLDSVVDLCYG